MDEQLAAAQAALNAGRGAEAIAPLLALLADDPAQDASIYRALLTQLSRAGRFEEAVNWGEAGAGRHPRDVEILNLLGWATLRLRRHGEALAAFDQALKVDPTNPALQTNRGNVLLEMRDGVRAEAVFASLARADPKNGVYQRQLGHALYQQAKRPAALARFRQAVALRKDLVDAWIDLTSLLAETHDYAGAEAAADRALAANPDHPRLLEARATVLRRSGAPERCEAYLLELLQRMPDAAWLHSQLGSLLAQKGERDRGNPHLRRAVELEPGNQGYRLALVESLERTRSGDEGANVEEAYQLARAVLAAPGAAARPGPAKTLAEILVRVCAFDEFAALPDFRTRGRAWAETGRHSALLNQLARVETLEDRYELLEQHRIWGRQAEGRAAEAPIRKLPRPAPSGKIRLGFLSSDLRNHPVGAFALPLFEHADAERFELYCYSFFEGDRSDEIQDLITARSTAYRWRPELGARDAAQMIADDRLDLLIELGGSTHMNRLEVMAYRPAPVQASWLGYPHSAGLSTIDYLICDPFNAPPRRDLLVERPLILPSSWIALDRRVFSDAHLIADGLPQDRAGRITFGTANHPHKYNRATLATWAEVLRATPGSRFAFVRPEGGSESFRRNLLAEFAGLGIEQSRIAFNVTRGQHMAAYNDIDISLDTAPLTGGTTTAESLWMGVPVVSLVGEAFYERLSRSLLTNSGVADLAADDPGEYVRVAAALAADRDRRLALRHGLRDQIRAGPLGRTEQFAADFYDLIARTLRP